MHNQRIVLITLVLGIILSVSFSGCDATYKFPPITKQLDKLSLVSTYPGYIGDHNQMTPVCSIDDPLAPGKQPNGLILNFTLGLIGLKQEGVAFPGDMIIQKGSGAHKKNFRLANVDESTSMGIDRFQQDIQCLETLTSSALNKQCTGMQNPKTINKAVNFKSYFPCDEIGGITVCKHHTDTNDVGVIVMFDNSGSMDGWVYPNTFQEAGKIDDSTVSNEILIHNDWATDKQWNAREQAFNAFESKLNPNYKLMAMRFGEFASTGSTTLLMAGCNAGLLSNPPPKGEKLWDQCFGVNRAMVDFGALKYTQNGTKGRTPLWYAVKQAYEYMKTKTDLKVKHIIIVDDSPDTCTTKSPFYNWAADPKKVSPCSTTGYQDFRAMLIKDLKANPDQNIHISFIQIQSWGYMERDTEQAEVACLTRGHYIFLNARQWGGDTYAYTAHLTEQLKQAMRNLANTLQGFWQYGFNIVDLSDKSKIPAGTLAAASGTLTLTGGKSDSLSKDSTKMTFEMKAPPSNTTTSSLTKAESADGVDAKDATSTTDTGAITDTVSDTAPDTVSAKDPGTTTDTGKDTYTPPKPPSYAYMDQRAVIRIPCNTGTSCTKSKSFMDQPKSFLDSSCIVSPPKCVEDLGLCHWEYAGEGSKCASGKKCTLGKCK